MDNVVEFDMKELFGTLVKRAWIIVLCAIIVGAAVLAYTVRFVTPMYQASVTLYVNNNSSESGPVSSSNLAVALQLVKTYVNIIESETVLNKVISETGLMITADQLRSMLSAEAVKETEMFRVKINSSNPQMSADIANAIADIAPDEIAKIIEGSTAKVIDYAKVPTGRSSPSYTKNTVVGAAVGALLAAVFITLQMLMDTRIKNEADLERICNIPVLGAIPDFAQTTKQSEQKGGRGA